MLLRFSQSSITGATRAGTPLTELMDAVQAGTKLHAVRIVEHAGQIYSLDNRRLYVYQELRRNGIKVDIPFTRLDRLPRSVTRGGPPRFTTQNRGIAVDVNPPRFRVIPSSGG